MRFPGYVTFKVNDIGPVDETEVPKVIDFGSQELLSYVYTDPTYLTVSLKSARRTPQLRRALLSSRSHEALVELLIDEGRI